jgi:hypothetical protein
MLMTEESTVLKINKILQLLPDIYLIILIYDSKCENQLSDPSNALLTKSPHPLLVLADD